MRVPGPILRRLRARLFRLASRRAPDVVIGGAADPYLSRWHVIPRNPVFNVYLHYFQRSDDDRALHDHPWVNCSILLAGRYLEVTRGGVVARSAGDVVLRGPRAAHRIVLVGVGDPRPVWTLFITGPRVRQWGFHCPQGWRHWRDFTSKDGTTIGRGCE